LRCSHHFRTLLTTGNQGILARLRSRQLLLVATLPYIDLHAYGVKLLQCKNHSRPKRSRWTTHRDPQSHSRQPASRIRTYLLIDHIHEREASLHLPSLPYFTLAKCISLQTRYQDGPSCRRCRRQRWEPVAPRVRPGCSSGRRVVIVAGLDNLLNVLPIHYRYMPMEKAFTD
jgi:hypothetical protein